MGTPVISVTGLTKDFKVVRAVDQATFEVPAGSVFGFLGPNGAGKTTTIRLLLGLLAPSAGSARVFGHDVITEGAIVREKTGALLEQNGLYERLTAEDNLEYYARIWHMPSPERKTRIRELLEHFGLWERRHERAGKFSRGMKQKLAIARVLIHRPKLIFLDEPTAGLDPVAAVSLREDIARLSSGEGVTVFLTTHNLAEAEKLCNMVAVMNRGKLIAYGKPESLLTGSGGPEYVVTGKGFSDSIIAKTTAIPGVRRDSFKENALTFELADSSGPTAVIRVLIESGVMIEEVKRSRASLEDVFLHLMEENHAS
jgi:ABC-2 type transport system ATP-binding protein